MDRAFVPAVDIHRLSSGRILLADADEYASNQLAQCVGQAGYSPDVAHTGRQALMLLQSQRYDVLLLDMSLPDLDCIEFLGRARQHAPDMVIVAMTRTATLDTAIAAVKYQVSDYLVKTDDVDQMFASVSAALHQRAKQIQERMLLRALAEMMERLPRRDGTPSPADSAAFTDILHVSPVQLNIHDRTAIVYGDSNRVCRLTNDEVDLLALLMRRADRVVHFQELADAVLGHSTPERTAYSSVSHHVHRLRAKLEVIPRKPRILRTMRGRGYMFVSAAEADR